MKENILVSVIMPAYNAERHIEEAINSVLSQSHDCLELIVTDDNSTDRTKSIVSEISRRDARVKLFSLEKNSGAAAARNNSIKNAEGEFIAFLDSDDVWLEKKLEDQIAFMKSQKAAFSFTGYSIYKGCGVFDDKVIDSKTPDIIQYKDLLKKQCTVGCSTVLIDRSAFPEISMPNIRTGQDYALWLKLLRQYQKPAHNMKARLTGYRILENSISRNKVKKSMRQWQIYRELEKIKFIPACYYMFYYAKNAVFRR